MLFVLQVIISYFLKPPVVESIDATGGFKLDQDFYGKEKCTIVASKGQKGHLKVTYAGNLWWIHCEMHSISAFVLLLFTR